MRWSRIDRGVGVQCIVLAVLCCGPGQARGAEVIPIPQPGVTDADCGLQQAIDAHPGAVLQLQAGVMCQLDEPLLVPHGITIRGAEDADGISSTIQSSSHGLFVFAGPGEGEHVALLDLRLTASAFGVVALSATEVDLTVTASEIEAGGMALSSFGAELGTVRIEDSTLISQGNDAIHVQNSTYRSLEIRDNTIRAARTATEILNFPDFQDPASTGEAHIVGNHLTGATALAFEGDGQAAIELLDTNGPVLIQSNTIVLPGTPGGDTRSMGIWLANGTRDVEAIDNLLVAPGVGRGAGNAWIGLYLFDLPFLGDGSPHDNLFLANRFEGTWSTGTDVWTGHDNRFVDTDVRDAAFVGETSRFRFGPFGTHDVRFPAAAWVFRDPDDCPPTLVDLPANPTATGNTVVDASGVVQHYVDAADANHLLGPSPFVPLDSCWPEE